MSELVIQLPNYLYQRAEALAKREKISLDELVSLAVASHVSAWQTKGYMEERAQRGSWEKFKAVLQKAPDVEPAEWDRLPQGDSRSK